MYDDALIYCLIEKFTKPIVSGSMPAQVVAALAAASLVFRGSDPAYAGRLLGAALGLYGEISDADNRGSYSTIVQEDCRNPGDPDVVTALGSMLSMPSCGRICRALDGRGWGLTMARGTRSVIRGGCLMNATMARAFQLCIHRLLLHSQSIGGGRLPLCGSYERVLAADDGGIGGSAIDQYLSHSYYDDLAWAAAWLYRASSASHCSCYLHDTH